MCPRTETPTWAWALGKQARSEQSVELERKLVQTSTVYNSASHTLQFALLSTTLIKRARKSLEEGLISLNELRNLLVGRKGRRLEDWVVEVTETGFPSTEAGGDRQVCWPATNTVDISLQLSQSIQIYVKIYWQNCKIILLLCHDRYHRKTTQLSIVHRKKYTLYTRF